MKQRLQCYLRPYRRRWGLSQKELARLLGWKSGTTVSRLEQGKRQPTLRIALACFVIFGAQPTELFPRIFKKTDDTVINLVWDLYEELQGNSSRRNHAKLELLEDAIKRSDERKRQSDV
jgi:transcriptional regulator with XRE-family HTH domain